MKRTYIDWSQSLKSGRVKTGLDYYGMSVYLASISINHTTSLPVAELNIRFRFSLKEIKGATISCLIPGSCPMIFDLDKKCAKLGFYFHPDNRVDHIGNIKYSFDFRGKPFSKAAVEMLIKLFKEVLLVDESYLYYLRMTQETVLHKGKDNFIPHFEHLLESSGVKRPKS